MEDKNTTTFSGKCYKCGVEIKATYSNGDTAAINYSYAMERHLIQNHPKEEVEELNQ